MGLLFGAESIISALWVSCLRGVSSVDTQVDVPKVGFCTLSCEVVKS